MRRDTDAMQTRLRIGVGGRKALDDAHDIMGECYGLIGRLMAEVERLDRLSTCGRCGADGRG